MKSQKDYNQNSHSSPNNHLRTTNAKKSRLPESVVQGQIALLEYLALILFITLIGMSIYELSKHLMFAHSSSWTMHLYTIGFSGLIATIAGFIAFIKLRTIRRETFHERRLRRKLENEITERVKTEEKLRESEGRVRAIVDSAADGIITIGESGIIETFNKSAEGIFGFSAEEIIGENVSRLMPMPFRATHDDYIADYLKTGIPKIIGSGREVEGKRKDGSTFPLDLAVSEFAVGDHRIFAGIVRDVGERRQMEAALREERNFITAVLSTSGALIIVMNRNGEIIRFNKACEETTGYSFEEVKGKFVWDLSLEPSQADSVKYLFNSLQASRFPYEFEKQWVIKNGSYRLIAWKYTALLGEEGNVQDIIGTGIDVTEQRKAEEKAKQHQAELAHLDRLSVMGEMATGLAHELNQPLAAAYAYSKACQVMARNGQEKSDKFSKALEQLAGTTERAGLIIRRLRSFIGKQETNKIKIDVKERIDEITGLTQTQLSGKEIKLIREIDDHLPAAFADPVQIDQVLLNLVRNSIEAMTKSDEKRILFRANEVENSKIKITVQDTGPGIANEQVEQIFNAFHTTKADGMGMGLAISRSIIEAHNGKLWAEAIASGGTAFHFTLPVANTETENE